MDYLGKWPEMRVIGQPVTEEQANEIILRTSHSMFFSNTNDREWRATVEDIMGFKGRKHPATFEENMAILDANFARAEELGFLNLEYIYNSRIASAYIGGPHGWMDWDGTISGDNPYNVGKWPEADELIQEWTTVAEAFPFLDLTAQFSFNEEETYLVLEIVVKDGKVTVTEDPASFGPIKRTTLEDHIESIVTEGGFWTFKRERGVSEARLRAAVEQLEASRTAS